MSASFFLIIGSGCVSVSSYHTARTIDEGDTEIGVVIEAASEPDSDGVILESPQLHARRGMSDTVDMGFRAGSFGIGIDANYVFADTGDMAFSISPNLVYNGTKSLGDDDASDFFEVDYTILTYYGTLLADLYTSDPLTVTLGFKGGVNSAMIEDEDGEHTPFIGGSAAMKIQIDGIYLIPEFNWNYIFAEDDEETVWTAGLGFMF